MQKILAKERKSIAEFLSHAQVHYINKDIEQKAIEQKQMNKIAIPDAIIAATALLNNFIVVTRNTKDFEKISDIAI